ncbi:MAG: bifunctional hydroxymethylpyrimidine kinase/phosphomethylpyrimidine kinase [Bacteroidales bacterium]|nr:bifunctional hydroxymethylpyrimidine kinase/phosphomethylpyrimidine kinase [Bacteroidales bacterium]
MIFPSVLTIAGSDSGGCAGIQADIKTISATGSYAAGAITAVTAQNTLGVREVFPVPPQVIGSQIRAVLDDIRIDAIKIGMLFSAGAVSEVARALSGYDLPPVVLDPVMVSTSGHSLMEDGAAGALAGELLPLCTLITPNIPEAEALSGVEIRSESDFGEAASVISKLSSPGLSVLLKGGHLHSDILSDLFYNARTGGFTWFRKPRTDTPNTHGTGCTLSSAVASFIARGQSLDDAVGSAEDYIARAVETSILYRIGNGHGPVNHFYKNNSGI